MCPPIFHLPQKHICRYAYMFECLVSQPLTPFCFVAQIRISGIMFSMLFGGYAVAMDSVVMVTIMKTLIMIHGATGVRKVVQLRGERVWSQIGSNQSGLL